MKLLLPTQPRTTPNEREDEMFWVAAIIAVCICLILAQDTYEGPP